MELNSVTDAIIAASIRVHTELGPGLLESVYQQALEYELLDSGLMVAAQVKIPIMYRDLEIPAAFRADLIVEDHVIVELKSVRAIEDIHLKQLLSYLRLSGKRLGLLINFNEILLKNGIRRVVNGY